MYQYQIDQQRNLISVTAAGDIDLKSSKEMLATVMADARFNVTADFLVDVRAMSAVPSTEDVRQFSDVLARVGMLCGRFAVVAAPGVQFGVGRMMATFVTLRGIDMHIFQQPSDAVAWLSREAAN